MDDVKEKRGLKVSLSSDIEVGARASARVRVKSLPLRRPISNGRLPFSLWAFCLAKSLIAAICFEFGKKNHSGKQLHLLELIQKSQSE